MFENAYLNIDWTKWPLLQHKVKTQTSGKALVLTCHKPDVLQEAQAAFQVKLWDEFKHHSLVYWNGQWLWPKELKTPLIVREMHEAVEETSNAEGQAEAT